MDSLTQIALDAAVGETVLGQRVGRKAALWGAILGTLPDLDVLIPFGESHWPVDRLQWFTKGFYRVGQEGQSVVITDLRMGGGDYYVFRFKVGEVATQRARLAEAASNF